MRDGEMLVRCSGQTWVCEPDSSCGAYEGLQQFAESKARAQLAELGRALLLSKGYASGSVEVRSVHCEIIGGGSIKDIYYSGIARIVPARAAAPAAACA